MASMTKNDITIVGTIGKPGTKFSATFSPLNTEIPTDVGKVIEEEIAELNPVQKGYNDDMAKYAKQNKHYKEIVK